MSSLCCATSKPTDASIVWKVLVIQEDKYDWESLFVDALNRFEGPSLKVKVTQTSWANLIVGPCENTFNPRTGRFGTAQVTVTALWKNGQKQEQRPPLMFSPDFILIRNEVTSPLADYRDQLLGLMYANVCSINSLKSILLNCDKPMMQSALNRIRSDRFADRPDAFPLIPQSFFPSTKGFFYGMSFPAVVKFGSAHAGMGKLRVLNHHDMEDIRSLLPLTKAGFATAEPFIDNSTDLRVQKIGSVIRAFQRVSVSGNWKSNMGTAHLTEIEATDELRQWATAAEVMFGNGEEDKMHILTVDAVVVGQTAADPGGQQKFILEVNGTSSGLMPQYEQEDNLMIAQLVLQSLANL